MAFQAEGPDVFQIAFSAAFDYRYDMVGVPQTFSAGRSETEPPFQPSLQTGSATQSLHMAPGRQAIDAAVSADTVIACHYFFADISWVGTQAPFLNAPGRAESDAALRYFQIAPPAQIAAVRAFWKPILIGPPPRHSSRGTHGSIMRFGPGELSTAARETPILPVFLSLRTEQEYTGLHLTLKELAAQPGFGYTPQLHQLQVQGCGAPCCG